MIPTPRNETTENSDDVGLRADHMEKHLPPRPREENFFLDVIRFAFIALCIVVPIRIFVAQPFIVNGSSMDPAFATGQYLIIDELTYRFRDPVRGEVVVFGFPRDPKKFFIKRVIGLPGETVIVNEGILRIADAEHPDGVPLPEPYVVHSAAPTRTLRLVLGNEEFFVAGDNRAASYDSREWGSLEKNLIVGRALLRLFPFDTISFLPGTDRANSL